MKLRKRITLAFLTLALASTAIVGGCKEDNSGLTESDLISSEIYSKSDSLDCSCIINPSDEISTEEEALLKYMREEEKLARDVYTNFPTQYSLPILTIFLKVNKDTWIGYYVF